MSDLEKTLQQYINSMRYAFDYVEEMKEQYEGMVDSIEEDMKKYQPAEWYGMTIADLDSVLQWYGF